MASGRPRKEDARVARTYKLPPALVAAVEARAAVLGMSRTAFVQRALEAALGAQTGSGAPRVLSSSRTPAGAPVEPRALAPGELRAQQFRRAAARSR